MRLAEKFDASGKIILNPGKEPVPKCEWQFNYIYKGIGDGYNHWENEYVKKEWDRRNEI